WRQRVLGLAGRVKLPIDFRRRLVFAATKVIERFWDHRSVIFVVAGGGELNLHDLTQRDEFALDRHRDYHLFAEQPVAFDNALDGGKAALGLDGGDVRAIVDQPPDQRRRDIRRMNST